VGMRDDVERILASKPDGMTQAEVVKALKEEGIKVRSDIIRKRLNELSRYNPPRAWRDEAGVWHTGQKVTSANPISHASPEVSETPPAQGTDASPAPVTVPGDREEFKKLGMAVGMVDPMLDAICDYVFGGNPLDIDWVAEALTSMHLRPDIERRWIRLWQMAINAPTSPELKARLELPIPDSAQSKQVARRRCTLVGNEIFPDPDGEFDSPQQALVFSKAQQSLHGQDPAGGESNAVTLAKALVDIKGVPQQTINWTEIIQALKQDPQDIISLIQTFSPHPEPKPDTLGRIIDLLRTNPTLIQDTLKTLRGFLGIDQLESRLANISSQPSMIKIGDGGLPLSEYHDHINFLDTRAERAETRQMKKEEHDHRMSLYTGLRENLPTIVAAADRAIGRMTANRPPGPPDSPRQPGPTPLPTVELEGTCPECGTTLRAPKDNPRVECPQCHSTVELRTIEGGD